MHVVVDTARLEADNVISPEARQIMEARSRETMVSLAINMLLMTGILFATFGLIFWLGAAATVAIAGLLLLGGGLTVLARASDTYAMFGNAGALIGAGLLIGGSAIELSSKYPQIAGPAMTAIGLLVMAIAARAFLGTSLSSKFVVGAIGLMGLGLHLFGIGFWLNENEATGLIGAIFCLYAAALILASGWLVDIRLITALAIIPYAQTLEAGTRYFHAIYAFYSPESTLTIVMMAVLMIACLWTMRTKAERDARHARMLATMAFIVANLSALVGSLWGDRVGEHVWGSGHYDRANYADYTAWQNARDAFLETAFIIPDWAYAIGWAVALLALIVWSASRGHRALFNTGVTFAAIHAYTQAFETFGDEPLAYVIGGLAAIPLAWGLWRLNSGWISQTNQGDP